MKSSNIVVTLTLAIPLSFMATPNLGAVATTAATSGDGNMPFSSGSVGEAATRQCIDRIKSMFKKLRLYFSSAEQSRALDWNRVGEDVWQIAEECARHDISDADMSQLRTMASITLRRAKKLSPDNGVGVRKLFESSRNALILELAKGDYAIEEAKTTPMTMQFTAIDGREVNLAELRGKVVLLDFRGVTWCGACRSEEPYMREAYEQYRDRGFEIVTITYEMKSESREFVLNYMREKNLVWPHYFDGQGHNNPYVRRFGITSVPQHFLLDKEGLLASTDVRGEKLAPAIEKLLQAGDQY